jgi:hypothetical protein
MKVELQLRAFELEKAMRRTRNRKDAQGLRIYSMSHSKARQELMSLLAAGIAQGRREAAEAYCNECGACIPVSAGCKYRQTILGTASAEKTDDD